MSRLSHPSVLRQLARHIREPHFTWLTAEALSVSLDPSVPDVERERAALMDALWVLRPEAIP